jgi:hypothetical protein
MSTTGTTLFATPATAEAIAGAGAIVTLVGGYDGSGNFGDIVQLDAALALVGRLSPAVVPVPVLERQYLASHRELGEEGRDVAPLAVFFDPDGDIDDELVPVAAPVDLAFGASYLYGGGYLNRLWGPRKLAMLAAAEALHAAGGSAPSCRLASGLQAEPEWLADGGAAALEGFDLLGARDPLSQEGLAQLGAPAAVSASGDDAVGLLRHLSPPAPREDDGTLRLNLHFSEHAWVSERPRELLDFHAGFAAELGRLAARPVVAQPLIAYLDRRVDERPGLERLREACAARGVEITEPLVLRPQALAEAAAKLGGASLTLSCSYHVALTSLLLEVPTVLIADNPYYEQKAAGLRKDFGLPAPFSASSAGEPAAGAAEIAALLFDLDRASDLRARLAAAGARLRLRRIEAELELLARLAAAATSALAERTLALGERLRLRSAEPAELRAQLSALVTEQEELQRRLASSSSPLETELRVQAEAREAAAQQALATVLGSRSWRLAAPLRRLGALRRRG